MLFEQAQQMIAAQLRIDPQSIKPESRLIDDLKADSLDIVELIMEIEQQYDIEVPDDAMVGMSTVQDVVNYIESCR
ncbi:MAG: acyl carrier protein [Clostridia bacterium]|nr:acyl carrier protein [Clostridia bacterium]